MKRHHVTCKRCNSAQLAKSPKDAKEIADIHDSVVHNGRTSAKPGWHRASGKGWDIDRKELTV